jgi:predicted Zn-dependent protease
VRKIYVANLSPLEEIFLSQTLKRIEEKLRRYSKEIKLEFNELATLKFKANLGKPLFAFDLLSKYKEMRFPSDGRLLLIIDSNLYLRKFFPPKKTTGVAFPNHNFSILSISDLKDKDEKKFFDCLEKGMLHEIGHLYHLDDHRVEMSLEGALKRKVLKFFGRRQKEIKFTPNCVMEKLCLRGYLPFLLPIPQVIWADLFKEEFKRFLDSRPKSYCRDCSSKLEKILR